MSREGERPRKRWLELRDEIKRRIEYRSFYLRYCPEARQTGARLQALCPIPAHAHSGKGHPSLSVDLQQGLFNCFSRGEGGDALKFYQLMHGVTFAEAVRLLARDLGVGDGGGDGDSDARRPSLAAASAPDAELAADDAGGEFAPLEEGRMRAVCERFLEVCREEEQLEGVNYLARRGIDSRTAREAGLAYFPRRAYRRVMRRMLDCFPLEALQRGGLFNRKEHLTFYRHRLLFPFLVEGRAVYLQARTTASGVEPRWHNMRGPVPSLYNLDALRNLPSGSVVHLVEGFTDTLTLAAHGFHAVGLVGAGGLKDEWLAPLGRFRVVAALDPDDAGRRAAARYRERFARRGSGLAVINLPTDVNDFFRQHPAAALEFELLTETALEETMNDEL